MNNKDLFVAGYKASGKGFYDHEIEEAWIRFNHNHTIKDNELDRHSPLTLVIKCMQEAVRQLSDNDYIYADDEASTNIHHEEVEVIVNLLSHSKMSAVEINDVWEEL